jgi:FkbM family methyltransferase
MKTFVEIGSCFFNTLTSLCDLGWRGVVVEPQPEALELIPEHENLIKVEGAITTDFEVRTLKRVKPSIWDELEDKDFIGMASLSTKHPIYDKFVPSTVEEMQVGCVPFEFLMDQLGITKIDYLKIDTEGLDFDIIKSIDFKKFDIKYIKFEYEHSLDLGYTLVEMLDFMKENHYYTEYYEIPSDIIAFKI